MKRLVSKTFLVVIFLTSLSGCSLKCGEHIKLQVCGSYAVPGMRGWDLKGTKVQYEVIERDSYGRILFAHTTFNCITDQEETAYVIAQKLADDYVYFYEDICYQFSSDDFSDLKTTNDWEKELNQNKITRGAMAVTLDLFLQSDLELDGDTMRKAYCQEYKVPISQIKQLLFMAKNENGKEMYLLELETVPAQKYILVFDEAYHIYRLPINGDFSDYELIAPFKESCGWYQ